MKVVYFHFIVCVLIFGACVPSTTTTSLPGPSPSFTPYVGGTETALSIALATPTPWVAGTQTALAISSASPTPPALPTFAFTPEASQPVFESTYTVDQISPIFYGSFQSFILLGATAQDTWLHPREVYGLLYDDHMYDLYFNNELIGTGTAHVKVEQNQGPPGTCEYYDVDQSLMEGEPPSFGFKQGQAVAIRPPQEISTDNAEYQQYISKWLALQQVPNPIVNITRIVRVDIEGDGSDEVFISASDFAEETGHMVVEGDYSVVIMRKVVGNEVYTVPLVSDIYRADTPVLKYPPTHLLDNAFDLNGDGKLEVIVTSTWWEGNGVHVYEIYGIGADEVLNVSCGLVAQN